MVDNAHAEILPLFGMRGDIIGGYQVRQRAPCYDVASVRKRDGAKRHDTFSLNVGKVCISCERNAAAGCSAHSFSARRRMSRAAVF